MKSIRAILRSLGLVFFTLWYLTPILIRSAIRGVDLRHALELRKRWAKRVVSLLGIRIVQSGEISTGGPAVFISNHRSYIDPIIALCTIKALPVAKAEVSSWPLIGFAARSTGIHFVKRESQSSRRSTLSGMKTTMETGHAVLIYPEGTTHTDPEVMPFRRGAFHLAAMEKYPVVPMAIDYERVSDAWIGDDTFLPHFIKTFGNKRTNVWIEYGQPLYGEDARDLLASTESWINNRLRSFRDDHGAMSS